jgi:membrane protein
MSATPNQAPIPNVTSAPKRKPIVEGASVAFAKSISGGLGAIVSKDGPKGSIDILRLAIHSALQAQLTRMAAALTYRTIFSLIPIMVIGVAILGAFSTEDQVRQSITRILQFGGLAIDAAVVASDGATPEVGGKGIEQWILELVGRVRGVSYSGVAIIGILTLIYGAISMLIEIEMAFNQVYHAPAGRSWSRRITQYWTLLTLGPVLLFASFAVGEQFQSLVSSMSVRAAESTSVQQFMVGFAGYSATVAISTLMLWVIYVTVPNTKVRMRAAVIGALIAAILWELGKWGFRAYVASGSVKQLYGALFLLPLFMLWIYVTWMIVLAGLQLSFSLQMFWEVREQGDSFWKRFLNPTPPGPSLVDGGFGVGLPLMVVLAKRFGEGKPSKAGELAGEFALSEPVTLDILQRFVNAGLLHRVSTGDESDRAFVLSRPPESIMGEEIVTAGDPMWEGADRSPHSALLRSTRESRLMGVRGKTLAALAESPSAT